MEDKKKSEGYISRGLRKAKEKVIILQESLWKKNKEVEDLKEENEKLRDEIKKLKEELEAKSKRKLPSWIKPNVGNKKKKKIGPPQGHPSYPRKRPEKIDREVVIIPEQCPKCENDLAFPSKWHEHYQIDIPVVSEAIVTKFVVGWGYCKCCKKQVCSHQKLKYSQYGPNLHAYVSYLKFKMGLTLGKISNLLNEQYKLNLSTGQLSEILHRCREKFEEEYSSIGRDLRNQDHIHADETGWRSEGNSKWLWSFANDKLSYYIIKDNRCQKNIDEIFGDSFKGILSSDFYNAYDKIECRKQKCWVHLLRELKKLQELYPKDGEVKYFKSRLKGFYHAGINLQEEYNLGIMDERDYKELHSKTQRYSMRRFKRKELRVLAKRMFKYRDELYTFIKTGISPNNNFAEREIRPAVLMRKTSYGNRSEQGEKTQSVLMSIINTASKQGFRYTEYCSNYLTN